MTATAPTQRRQPHNPTTTDAATRPAALTVTEHPATDNTNTGHLVTGEPVGDGLPYGLAEDDAARRFIGTQINSPHPRAWRRLLSARRAEQTQRALVALMLDVHAQHADRKRVFGTVELAHRQGRLSERELTQARLDYDTWKARVAHYRRAVQQHLDEAKHHAKQARIARAHAEDAAAEAGFVGVGEPADSRWR